MFYRGIEGGVRIGLCYAVSTESAAIPCCEQAWWFVIKIVCHLFYLSPFFFLRSLRIGFNIFWHTLSPSLSLYPTWHWPSSCVFLMIEESKWVFRTQRSELTWIWDELRESYESQDGDRKKKKKTKGWELLNQHCTNHVFF